MLRFSMAIQVSGCLEYNITKKSEQKEGEEKSMNTEIGGGRTGFFFFRRLFVYLIPIKLPKVHLYIYTRQVLRNKQPNTFHLTEGNKKCLQKIHQIQVEVAMIVMVRREVDFQPHLKEIIRLVYERRHWMIQLIYSCKLWMKQTLSFIQIFTQQQNTFRFFFFGYFRALVVIIPVIFVLLVCLITYCVYRQRHSRSNRSSADTSNGSKISSFFSSKDDFSLLVERSRSPIATIIYNGQHNPFILEDLPPPYDSLSETKKDPNEAIQLTVLPNSNHQVTAAASMVRPTAPTPSPGYLTIAEPTPK